MFLWSMQWEVSAVQHPEPRLNRERKTTNAQLPSETLQEVNTRPLRNRRRDGDGGAAVARAGARAAAAAAAYSDCNAFRSL